MAKNDLKVVVLPFVGLFVLMFIVAISVKVLFPEQADAPSGTNTHRLYSTQFDAVEMCQFALDNQLAGTPHTNPSLSLWDQEDYSDGWRRVFTYQTTNAFGAKLSYRATCTVRKENGKINYVDIGTPVQVME
jgi:hypothetical protein